MSRTADTPTPAPQSPTSDESFPAFARRRRVRPALAAALTLVVAGPVAAWATSNPAVHVTGCVKSSTGALVKVKTGDAPLSACATGETEVQLSGGDITAVSAGTGLAGGASAGAASLGIAGTYRLPQGCATGVPAKRSSTGWYCGTDFGQMGTTTAPLSAVSDGGTTDCVGDVSWPLSEYTPPTGATTSYGPYFSLATGTYSLDTAGATRWFVSKTVDQLDGEQFAGGYVQIELERARAGVTSIVATWARAESENLAGGGLPYNRDLGTITALGGDSYRVKVSARAFRCSKAELKDAQVQLFRVG